MYIWFHRSTGQSVKFTLNKGLVTLWLSACRAVFLLCLSCSKMETKSISSRKQTFERKKIDNRLFALFQFSYYFVTFNPPLTKSWCRVGFEWKGFLIISVQTYIKPSDHSVIRSFVDGQVPVTIQLAIKVVFTWSTQRFSWTTRLGNYFLSIRFLKIMKCLINRLLSRALQFRIVYQIKNCNRISSIKNNHKSCKNWQSNVLLSMSQWPFNPLWSKKKETLAQYKLFY